MVQRSIVGRTEMDVSMSLAAFGFKVYGAFERLSEAIEKMLAVGFPLIKQIYKHNHPILCVCDSSLPP